MTGLTLGSEMGELTRGSTAPLSEGITCGVEEILDNADLKYYGWGECLGCLLGCGMGLRSVVCFSLQICSGLSLRFSWEITSGSSLS